MEKVEVGSSEITLRPYEISDVDDFMVYAGDDKVVQSSRWEKFHSKQEALTFIEESCIPHPYCRSICLDNRSIGYVRVQPLSGYDRCRAEIGYVLAAKYWGQGIATKASKIAIFEALEKFPDVVRIEGFVEADNKASQRVLEKLGFLKEGLLRKYTYNKGEIKDLVLYSLISPNCYCAI